MTGKQFVEDLIPEFLDIEVIEKDASDKQAEELIEISAEHDGHTYKGEIAFQEENGDEIRQLQVRTMVDTIVESAMNDKK